MGPAFWMLHQANAQLKERQSCQDKGNTQPIDSLNPDTLQQAIKYVSNFSIMKAEYYAHVAIFY